MLNFPNQIQNEHTDTSMISELFAKYSFNYLNTPSVVANFSFCYNSLLCDSRHWWFCWFCCQHVFSSQLYVRQIKVWVFALPSMSVIQVGVLSHILPQLFYWHGSVLGMTHKVKSNDRNWRTHVIQIVLLQLNAATKLISSGTGVQAWSSKEMPTKALERRD